MKINLSADAMKQINLLFRTRDANMRKAEKYNEILDSKRNVVVEEEPLPIREIDPTPYLRDPYYLHVQPKELVRGRWRLFLSSYQPHEGFVYDELLIEKEKNYAETTRFGDFTKQFPILAL